MGAGDRLGAMDVLRHALGYWRPHARAGVVLILLLLVQQGYGATFAYALKSLIDTAIPQQDTGAVPRIIGLLVAGYALAVAAQITAEYLGARIAGSILADLRLKMFVQLQRLSLGYHSRTHSGDLASRFSG